MERRYRRRRRGLPDGNGDFDIPGETGDPDEYLDDAGDDYAWSDYGDDDWSGGGQSARSANSGGSDRAGLWLLGTLLLLILSVAVIVTAVQNTGGSTGSGDTDGSASTQDAAAPSDREQAAQIEARLTAVTEDISSRYGATVGVSVRAGGGVIHAGEIEDARAWSSVKVPVALAAVQQAEADGTIDDLTEDIEAALTMSDNDAVLRLWETLGTDEESSAAVDDIFRQVGDPTDAEADRANDDYEGFGDIHWSLDNQVLFANRLACLDGADRVLDPMGQVVPGQRRGLGLLPGARFKGGWGVEPDGEYLLREFGLVGETGSQVPVSYAVIPDDGEGDTRAREIGGALAEALAPVLADLADEGGAAECQPSADLPAASTEAPVDTDETGEAVDGTDSDGSGL